MYQFKSVVIGTTLILMMVLKIHAQHSDIFSEYQQILPRGKIAAIFNPEYVPADVAEITDSTWVLGIIIDGKPRAYSLNLLNHHEVVNDRIDTTDFAAVW